MSLQDIENTTIGILAISQDRTPERVRQTLNTVLMLFPQVQASITQEQIEDAAKRIETRLSIRMNDAAAIQADFEEWLPRRRGEMDPYFYNRYRKYLSNRGFSPSVLGVLDKDTDRVVGLLEDPEKAGGWSRRGLVVGHVQSGKTANYTGVICKAADYGYRFIVVLTGIQEDLRVQTQERIEEGFIGISSEATLPQDSKIGVGLYDLSRRPVSLTSRDSDFRTTATQLQVSLQAVSEPLVLIMKKNARILANLIDWIKLKTQAGGGRVSGVPMLLIDDEADNASVNVSVEGNSPSAINGRIRELLDLFDRNVYLGYTATPFANIFIDPASTDDLKREDLFPRDFIVCLDAPTNYVGASRIFSEDGDLNAGLVEINDHSELLPERHKITHDPKALPESLEEAVRTFVLARAVKLLRGQGASHTSMLVNVSRFNDVQTKLTGLVNNLLNSIRTACRGHAALDEIEALRDPEVRALREAWDAQYEGRVPETWPQVQRTLVQAVGPVEVRKVNSKSADKLDYRRYKQDGLHVIAIGGFTLSRGFTLEGLTVSYFLRNSLMYDTLLQMGRWFGYRDGYVDLCRIYMTGEAIAWYAHISEAIDELREEFKVMERARRRPVDFGLKVRRHPDSLIVTARNKMRSGKPVLWSVNLSGQLIETTALRRDALEENRQTLATLVANLTKSFGAATAVDGKHIWAAVPAAGPVRQFVQEFLNHDDACPKTQSGPVSEYIRVREDAELAQWDICIFSPSSGIPSGVDFHGVRPNLQTRASVWHGDDIGRGFYSVSGKSARVGSRGQEKAGMTAEECKEAEEGFRKLPGNAAKSVPDWAYRAKRTRPLLMLHVLDIKDEDRGVTDPDVVAWGISFPASEDSEGTTVSYVVNTTWWATNYGEDAQEIEDEINEA